MNSKEFSKLFQEEIKLVFADYWRSEEQVKDLLRKRGYGDRMVTFLYDRFRAIHGTSDWQGKVWWKHADKIPKLPLTAVGDYHIVTMVDGERVLVPAADLKPYKPDERTIVQRVYDTRNSEWRTLLNEKFGRIGIRNNPRTVKFDNNKQWYLAFSSKTYVDLACLPTKPPSFPGFAGHICMQLEAEYTTELEGYLVREGLGIKVPRTFDRYTSIQNTCAYRYYWISYENHEVCDSTLKKAISKMDTKVRKDVLARLG